LPAIVAVYPAQAQTQPLTVTVGAGTSATSANFLLNTSTTANQYVRTVSILSAAELTAVGAAAGSQPLAPG